MGTSAGKALMDAAIIGFGVVLGSVLGRKRRHLR